MGATLTRLTFHVSQSEVYAAFRYFNAISLLVTAMWRSSAAASHPTASSSPESAAFNGSFPALPGGSGRSDARGTVLLKAVLLDWQPGGRGFVSVRELEYRDVAWRRLRKGGGGTYEVSDRSSHAWIGRVDWPGARQLEPDPECVLKEIGCGGPGSSEFVLLVSTVKFISGTESLRLKRAVDG